MILKNDYNEGEKMMLCMTDSVPENIQKEHVEETTFSIGNDVTQDIALDYEVEKLSEQIIAENDAVYKALAK